MLAYHLLAKTLQEDREREIRERLQRVGGVPSGRRHPAPAEHGGPGGAGNEAADRRPASPRRWVAFGGGR